MSRAWLVLLLVAGGASCSKRRSAKQAPASGSESFEQQLILDTATVGNDEFRFWSFSIPEGWVARIRVQVKEGGGVDVMLIDPRYEKAANETHGVVKYYPSSSEKDVRSFDKEWSIAGGYSLAIKESSAIGLRAGGPTKTAGVEIRVSIKPE